MSRKSIAETLKDKRKEIHLSVKDVTGRLASEHDIKISDSTMYSYEIGHRQPDADTLLALCVIYGVVDVLALFGYAEPINVPPMVESISPSHCLLANAYDAADEVTKLNIRKLLDVPTNYDSDQEEIEREVAAYRERLEAGKQEIQTWSGFPNKREA